MRHNDGSYHDPGAGCSGRELAYLRRLAGMRQEKLAELLGVSLRTVARWESPDGGGPREAWEVLMRSIPPARELLRELAEADPQERDRLFFAFVDRERLLAVFGENPGSWADADRLRAERGTSWADLAGCLVDPEAMVREEYQALRAGDAVRFKILRGLRAWFSLDVKPAWWGDSRPVPQECPLTSEQLRRISDWILG